ncbi:zinc finger CCCH domain-containing protein 8 isoform X8 [Physcomitrium patens]|uniref:zinc finger CCCH domain-containing protein 8 isoform X8 n=1 Tax=Physcomitrium patens TaxID=3218 RepID=UPI000D168872|nr:zinc finger CCCH domain-containing protein ZFN-like isoform X6 [Physcomitrium patens]|eukprot:XP_024368797.1 zinc finger CCCH domain-containing protein ZFN-like isoform X6 [Physcomitrella patens]
MTAASHQVVYAISTPPHGVVHYEYYTQQVPQTTTATPFAAFAQYSSSAPPPSGAIAMDQSADGAAKRLSDGVTDDMTGPNKKPRSNSSGVSGENGLYPQRPGQKVCAYYMATRTCSFGVTCRYDHPAWLPPGGIPSWKEVTAVGTPVDPCLLPQRPAEPDCAYFMKTGECRYGPQCRFNHPKEKLEPSNTDDQYSAASSAAFGNPATAYNTNGLPLRPGEGNCVFYGKTGSCKHGPACRYNHPEIVFPAGGRTGQTLQPQQAVYVQPPQQPNSQYQMVQEAKLYMQATPDYSYPATTYQSTTPTYTTAPTAYPVATTYSTAAPAYASPAAPYTGQQVITEYVYPGGAMMQVYPAGSTTQGYPPETPTQSYSQGTTDQAVEYAYAAGQQPQCQEDYTYATQQVSRNGTEYMYSTEQPGQGASDQYATTVYTSEASGQPSTGDYACTAAHNSQEYMYAAAQAYHQNVTSVYATPMSLPHPQRPGEPDCTFYIKTGECSFGATCKFHHPPDRIPTGIPKPAKNQGLVKLSLAGLPRRETEAPCAYYMKTGACKFGQTCKYDHPPPQEIIAKAVEQARGEIPVSCDVSMPGSNESDSQDATPLPPGTDAPAVTAACASST